jgi:hypothetical protein
MAFVPLHTFSSNLEDRVGQPSLLLLILLRFNSKSVQTMIDWRYERIFGICLFLREHQKGDNMRS